MIKETNYKWTPENGWVVECEDEIVKIIIEETLKEATRTINFEEYLNQNKEDE